MRCGAAWWPATPRPSRSSRGWARRWPSAWCSTCATSSAARENSWPRARSRMFARRWCRWGSPRRKRAKRWRPCRSTTARSRIFCAKPCRRRAADVDDDRLIEAAVVDPEDREFDVALRPRSLTEFVGQERVKEQLALLIDGARRRSEPVDHLLFSGPPGLGKTTLAQIVANEMGAGFQPTSGPALDRPSDLAAILTNLGDGDVLFVDEIHRMPRAVEEVLYPALEDFNLDVVLGKGPTARSIRLDLPRFTLVAATTRPGLITLPLRERFGFSPRLDYYSREELATIVLRSAGILAVRTDDDGADEI